MSKSDISLGPIAGLPAMGLAQEPYQCPSCGGTWLRMEDAERLGGRQRSGVIGSEAVAADTEVDSRTGFCPQGHGIMGRAKVSASEGFFLERCSQCWPIWFDGGEWSKLASHQLLSDLRLFWDSAWQAEQREKRRETEYQEWLQSRLGEPLFHELSSLATKLCGHPSRSEAMAFLNHELRS